MKKRINGVLLLLMSITMLFSACSKDPETKPITTDPEVKVGDILVYTMLMNPGGQTGIHKHGVNKYIANFYFRIGRDWFRFRVFATS